MKKLNQKKSCSKGFTLIELVVVIGILAVLFAIVLIAINPGRQFAQANDTKRRSDVNAILNAVSQYAADKKGDLGDLNITDTATLISSEDNKIDICDELVPKYISAMPSDPKTGEGTDCDNYSTGYSIATDDNGRITVSAVPEVDGVDSISVTR